MSPTYRYAYILVLSAVPLGDTILIDAAADDGERALENVVEGAVDINV